MVTATSPVRGSPKHLYLVVVKRKDNEIEPYIPGCY